MDSPKAPLRSHRGMTATNCSSITTGKSIEPPSTREEKGIRSIDLAATPRQMVYTSPETTRNPPPNCLHLSVSHNVSKETNNKTQYRRSITLDDCNNNMNDNLSNGVYSQDTSHTLGSDGIVHKIKSRGGDCKNPDTEMNSQDKNTDNGSNLNNNNAQLSSFRKPLSVLQRNIHQLSLRTVGLACAKEGQPAAESSQRTESPMDAVPFAACSPQSSSPSPSFSPPVNNSSNQNSFNRNIGSPLANDNVITKRRNFSSSSLPQGLISSTIEEVEDGDARGLIFPSNTYPYRCKQQLQHTGNSSSDNTVCGDYLHRSNSYTSSITTSTPAASRVSPYRTLRREPCIAGMNSPPKPPPRSLLSPLIRSASDNTKVSILKDVDIVGESFESRYPWQRDVSIQCFLDDVANSSEHPHYELHRSVSSPASCPFSRSISLTSNSPASSPPQPTRRHGLSYPNRSCSNSDLISYSSPTMFDDRGHSHPLPFTHQSCLNRRTALPSYSMDHAHCSVCAGGESNCSPPYQSRRANFSRRPRPNSTGAVENIRYQHELTKFREMHNSRRDRKSDPQLSAFSPGTCRKRVVTGSQDDQGSLTDLESILEYPGDRPWDISRHTSMTSVDFEEDMSRIVESGVLGNASKEVVEDYHKRDDVLHSPRVSPKYWATFDEDGDISGSDDSACLAESSLSFRQRSLSQQKQPRRLSSGSITSDAESEATEPDLPVARRGRRSAIYETKNCGDVSPTTLSPEASPSNSCDEGEGASNIAERLRRRRSSVDLAMNIYPGDLLVQEHHKKLIKRNTIADFYAAGRQPNGSPSAGTPSGPEGNDASKKGKQPFSLLKLMKTRSKESLTKIDEVLKRLKPSEFKDNHLAAYKSLHWSDLIASTDKQTNNSQLTKLSDTERKRREAVWELFKSECVFLIDHLMVLKHCFMEPLKKVQVEGSLMYAEPQDLFGNLDELSYVSYTFCKDFIAALLKDMSITDFGRTNVLLKAFQRFSAHSRDGAVFHSYCLNYTNALSYLEKLRTNAEFGEFEKWCEQDPRCNRLQLTDLLVAPMQHCTKLPLLLHNVMKYTADEDERQQVAESIEKVEASLKQLEEKMRWIKNYERVQEVQRQIVWPTVTELDPRCVIPECLKLTVSKQPCERLLTCPKRQLLYEGQVTLVETPKPLDVHMFLFDDILLITKIKKVQRKQKQSATDLQALADKTLSYVVLRQPLALDRFSLHDIGPTDASVNGLKHCFVLVQISRYQQITGVFTFQAPCEATKSTWLHQLKDAMDAYSKASSQRDNSTSKMNNKSAHSSTNNMISSALVREEHAMNNSHSHSNNNNNNVKKMEMSFYTGGNSNPLRNSSGRVPTKSRSMDAVYI